MKHLITQLFISIAYTIAILLLTRDFNSDGGGKGYAIFFFMLIAIAIHFIVNLILVVKYNWEWYTLSVPIVAGLLLFIWIANS